MADANAPNGTPPPASPFSGALGTFLRVVLQGLGVVFLVFFLFQLVKTVITDIRSRGLVIEAFAVPASLSDKGLTGQVFASEVVDQIRELAKTSERPGEDASISVVPPEVPIKVQISEAGISIDAVNTYIRSVLSHETHVSGELLQSGDAITAVARIDRNGAWPCEERGTASNVIEQLASCVLKQTDPYRYAAYVYSLGRNEEAREVYSEILGNAGTEQSAHTGLSSVFYDVQNAFVEKAQNLYGTIINKSETKQSERAWAHYGLGKLQHDVYENPTGAIAEYQEAITEADGKFSLAYRNLIEVEAEQGQDVQE